ncbi:MAG TPA: alpha/beta fold hydrolase [Ktedonobacterales bacterium]|nr:alpha/beta fold hydrolase [Ktedonobacterales bacterium]
MTVPLTVPPPTGAHDERHASQSGDMRGQRKAAVFCLLVHGLNGEPDDLAPVERALRAEGFATRSFWLPGHGTTPRDLRQSGWQDWYAKVRAEALAALHAGNDVALIGHSMGGSVCLALAAELAGRDGLRGVAALCPPMRMYGWMEKLLAAARRVVPYVPALGEDIRSRQARRGVRRRVQRWNAPAPMHSLLAALPEVRAALPRVRCPVLVVAARHDHVVPARDGLEAYERTGADHKELLLLERSYHAVAHDEEQREVCAQVVRFCRRIAPESPCVQSAP